MLDIINKINVLQNTFDFYPPRNPPVGVGLPLIVPECHAEILTPTLNFLKCESVRVTSRTNGLKLSG